MFHASRTKDDSISGDIDIVDPKTDRVVVQIDGLYCHPLTPTTQADDRLLFTRTVWGPLLPNAESVTFRSKPTQAQYLAACELERASWFYLARLESEVPKDHPSRHHGPYVALFEFVSRARSKREARGQPWWHEHWEKDTMQDIQASDDQNEHRADFDLLRTLGERIVDIVTGDVVAIEVAMQSNILSNYYQHGLGTADYTAYLAAFRFPHLECLEVGAGTGGATQAIFQEARQSFQSYTFTDISSGFFSAAETMFTDSNVRMIYKPLDINIDPGQQGFADHSYDVVVASLVLHTTVSLRQTLKNIRRLLKPGGYLVALELRKDLPVRWTAMFGCFPGWWIGSDDGRRLSPCIDVEEWHNLLQESGFSGCDTVTPTSDTFTQPLMVFVSQALDETVSYLRDPLSYLSHVDLPGFSHIPNELVVLGDGHSRGSRLVDNLDMHFRRRWTTIKTARTLEELASAELSPTCTVLSLIELDRPIFCDMSPTEWEQLKFLFQGPRSIIWITSGRRAGEPYANMLPGAVRIAKNETLGLTVQFIDFEDREQLNSSLLRVLLLRFQASISWQKELDNMAFAQIEREMIVSSGGELLVQRLIPDGAMNDRYNSSHRNIERLVDAQEYEVSLTSTRSGYVVQESWPNEKSNGNGNGDSYKQVSHSLLAPIIVSSQSLFLALGREEDSSHFLALSDHHSSRATAHGSLTCPVKVPEGCDTEFLTLASELCFTWEIVKGLEEGDHLLVLEPRSAVIRFLNQVGQEKGLRLTFLTVQANPLPKTRLVHLSTSNREMEALELFSVTVLMDFSERQQNERLVARLVSFVPRWCRYTSLHAENLGTQSATKTTTLRSTPRLRRELGRLAAQTSEYISQSVSEYKLADQVTLEEVCGNSRDIKPNSVVHWPSCDKVAVRVRPSDSSKLFSPNKTYWLVGLTGSLGISLCEWMINHGARYVVLSSRAPKVENCWLEEMASMGATVWIRFWYNPNTHPPVLETS
jgi:hybrid polyketide synthase/nonribosomal peptide synthetase ACE1